MLEDVVDFVIRPTGIFALVNSMAYVYCIKNSMETNHFVSNWRDHVRLGTDRFMLLVEDKKYQLFTASYMVLYYGDRIVIKIMPMLQ